MTQLVQVVLQPEDAHHTSQLHLQQTAASGKSLHMVHAELPNCLQFAGYSKGSQNYYAFKAVILYIL